MGDEVDIRVKVYGYGDYAYFGRVVGAPDPVCRHQFLRQELDAGKRVPRPIKVGDTVRENGIGGEAVVIGLDDGVAWTKYRNGIRRTPFVSNLVRVSS